MAPRRSLSATALLLLCTLSVRAGQAPAHKGHHAGPNAGLAKAATAAHERIKKLGAQCDADPKAWQPRFELGNLYISFGFVKSGLKRLEEVIALKPAYAPAYKLAGEAHLKLKEYDKAIALWKKLLEAQPELKMPPKWIAQAEAMKKADQHLAELGKQIEKRPGDPEARLARANLLAERGDWKAVLTDLEPVLAATPDAGEALTLAGNACLRLGQLDQAITHLQRAVAVDKNDVAAGLWLKKALATKETRTRLADVEARLSKSPKDGKLYLESSRLWFQLGQMKNGMGRLAKAVELLPKNVDAHREYAFVLLRVGRMDEGITHLETCVKLEPDNKAHTKLLEKAKKTRDMHKTLRKERSSVPAHGAAKAGDSQK
ncbi:tetratricopeptide repeat protein [bacterium]|nr:tetratricopeptide repeat protein [bacterium]